MTEEKIEKDLAAVREMFEQRIIERQRNIEFYGSPRAPVPKCLTGNNWLISFIRKIWLYLYHKHHFFGYLPDIWTEEQIAAMKEQGDKEPFVFNEILSNNPKKGEK